MKNYRITQRGKIVFTGLFIALIVFLVLMVSQFNKKIDPVSKELMINRDEIEKSNETTEKSVGENTMDNDDKMVETSTGPSIEVEIETDTEIETETKTDLSVDVNMDKKDEESLDYGEKTSKIENKVKENELETLYSLYYAPDGYKVSGKCAVILDTYYDLAIKNDSGIIIEGNYHLGKGYDEKMFVHLSYKRAINVKEYLVKKGVDENRITIIDNKNMKPLNKDGSDLEVGFNRRVDIYFEDFYK